MYKPHIKSWKTFDRFIFALIGIGVGILISTLYATMHTVVPAAQQSQVSVPISDGQALHGDMNDFLIADGYILVFAQHIQKNTNVGEYKLSQDYQDDSDQLSSHITMRSQTIASYNKQAHMMNVQDWKGICLPHSIADTTLNTRNLNTLIAQVQAEEKTLDAKVGGWPGC